MKRNTEIDVIKGLSVVMMVTFHIVYVMNNMGFNKPNSSGFFWSMLAKISHLTFITIAGINLYINYKNKILENKNLTKKDKTKYYFRKIKRALVLLLLGLVMTYTTKKIFGSNKSVKFGILHFMCSAILISIIVLKVNDIIPKSISYSLIGLIIIFTLLQQYSINKNFSGICKKVPMICFILGIYGSFNANIGSLDHHSIFSKYPFFALGMLIGKSFFGKNNKKIIDLEPCKNNKIVKGLKWLGEHSLEVYMIHWVIIYGIVYLAGGRPMINN